MSDELLLTTEVELLIQEDPNSNVVVFSDVGMQGPPGAMGATGTAGANGLNGLAGSAGVAGVAGQNGIDGINGTNGTNGLDGSGVDKNYIHNQGLPALVWVITHNLNKFPSVSVVDSAGTLVVGDITQLNQTTLTVGFNFAFSGKAFLN